MKKLDILVPQYSEDDSVIKPLLDSIMTQQNVDFSSIGVIICNDGSDIKLSKELLSSYPFSIKYIQGPHGGVSAARQRCLDNSKAEYIMFADADDMFYTNIGLWLVFKEIETSHFDALVSVFIEEGRDQENNSPIYFERGREDSGTDSTFVHGKVYRRKFLVNSKITWDNSLTIHEDSYFNIRAIRLAKIARYLGTPIWLWRWRDNSVCRHDPKYMLKTYSNYIDSNTALVLDFIARNKVELANRYVCHMIFDAYQTLNKAEWIEQENQEYRNAVEHRFKQYYLQFKDIYSSTPSELKQEMYSGVKTRSMLEGVFDEVITLRDWLAHIEALD